MPPTTRNSKILPYPEALGDWPFPRLVGLSAAKNLPDPNPLTKEGYAEIIVVSVATDPANTEIEETEGFFSFHVGSLPNIGVLPRGFEMENFAEEPDSNEEEEHDQPESASSSKRKASELEDNDPLSGNRTPDALAGETPDEQKMRSDFIDFLENNIGFSVDSMKARLKNLSRKCAGSRRRFDFYDSALRAAEDYSHMTPDAMRRSMIEWVGGKPPLEKEAMEFFTRHYKYDKKMHPRAPNSTPKGTSSSGRSRAPKTAPKKTFTCHHCGRTGHLQKDCKSRCGNAACARCPK